MKDEDVRATSSLQNAFKDLDSLMENAKEMVVLAERFSKKAKKEDSKDEDDVKDFLITMGIASPVTKQATGALYHQELSKQLADFLPKHLGKTGMITLIDAYSIYNRARGTDLISPEDLYRASSLFSQLNLNLILKKFDSGVIVIQSKKFDTEVMTENIVKKINASDKQSVSPVEISHMLKVPVVLAKETLMEIENRGVLCRDESLEGLRFYINFFKSSNLS